MAEERPQNVPAFLDARSKKVIIVAHCVLNQNARIDTCATAPAVFPKVVEALMERDIGILQYPCPELGFLGMGRQGQDCASWDGSYEHESGEVYDQMSVPEGREFLRGLAENLVYQIKEYRKYDFKVLGVLGIDHFQHPARQHTSVGNAEPAVGDLLVFEDTENDGISLDEGLTGAKGFDQLVDRAKEIQAEVGCGVEVLVH